MKKVFGCRAVSTALYGAETWSIAVAKKERLNAMEMRCLTSMCGVTRMDCFEK